MLTFRQKLFLAYLVVFLVFLLLLFPFASRVVEGIVRKTLSTRTDELIAIAKTAPDEAAMRRRLIKQTPYRFFQISVIAADGEVIYDSIEGTERRFPDHGEEHPEVAEAFRTGVGYSEGLSHAFGQRLAFMAKRFEFHGQMLVLRTAFPLSEVSELTEDFEIGFLTLGVIVLLLFSIMTTLVAHHLSRPIHTIIKAIKPYQQGESDRIPQIDLGRTVRRKDDFQSLADTLNSLTARIERQISDLQHERDEKEAVLETLVEGVVAIDLESTVTYANSKALQLLELAQEDLVNHNFSVVSSRELQELVAASLNQSEILAAMLQLGMRRQIYVDAIAVPSKQQLGVVLIMQDKSAHYRVLEMRKDFIANASHELKTPLTIIRGFAEALRDNPEMPREMASDITEKISRNCQRMEKLVKNLLRLADIENLPRGNLGRCDVKDLLESCRQMVLTAHPEATITLVVPKEEIFCLADEDLLELAVMNLLDNAAKYSDGPAQISAKLSVIPEREEIELVVADKGIGIPEEDLDRVFQRFFTVNKAHSRKLGGSGLGLSIVQTIIEKHFGSIRVESVLGEGSTFTLRIPKNLEKRL